MAPVTSRLDVAAAARHTQSLREAVVRRRELITSGARVRPVVWVTSWAQVLEHLVATARPTQAVLLEDDGTAWSADVTELAGQPWPPVLVVAAADQSWMLQGHGPRARLVPLA